MRKCFCLADRAVFKQIIKNRKVYTKHFFAYFKPNTVGHLRIAISVGKHNFKLAVARNKIKRQVRTYVDAITDKTTFPYDVLLVANKSYLPTEYHKNREDFFALLNRLNRPINKQIKNHNGRKIEPRRSHDL